MHNGIFYEHRERLKGSFTTILTVLLYLAANILQRSVLIVPFCSVSTLVSIAIIKFYIVTF